MAEENDMSWLNEYLRPSRRSFERFLGGQQRQYNPLIRLLGQQLGGMRPGQDPMVKAYDEILKGMRTGEQVSERFAGSRANIMRLIQESPLAAAGDRAGALVSAVGAAIGADPTQTALTSESSKSLAPDATRLAFQTGAESRLAGAEQEALAGLEERRQGATLGRADAKNAARERRMEVARLLAQTQGQRLAGRMNPLELAQMAGGFQDWMRSRGGYGGGFRSGSDGDGPPPDEVTVTDYRSPWERAASGAPAWTNYSGMPGGSGGAYSFTGLLGNVVTPNNQDYTNQNWRGRVLPPGATQPR
jgi:hypothetical protein